MGRLDRENQAVDRSLPRCLLFKARPALLRAAVGICRRDHDTRLISRPQSRDPHARSAALVSVEGSPPRREGHERVSEAVVHDPGATRRDSGSPGARHDGAEVEPVRAAIVEPDRERARQDAEQGWARQLCVSEARVCGRTQPIRPYG